MAAQEMKDLGSIVAFEGQPEIISTQLRLLPTSPHILILPPLQNYSTSGGFHQGNFDPRSFILAVHDALESRNKAAKAFLQESTAANKRLVFLNGGTASAHTLCIKTIMKHETDGNLGKAEALFTSLAKDGCIRPVEPDDKGPKPRSARKKPALEDEVQDDPITRAMRAADALDRETAGLQLSNELDLTLAGRSRSSSLPLYGYSDQVGDAAPFVAFGLDSMDDALSDACSTPMFAMARFDQSTSASSQVGTDSIRSFSPSTPKLGRDAPMLMSGPVSREGATLSPMSDRFSIRTLDNVVYGEASLLDMRYSVRRSSLTRVKSLDRIYPAASKFRDLCTPSLSQEIVTDLPEREPPQSARTVPVDIGSTVQLDDMERPRTVIVKTSRSTINLAPAPKNKKKKTSSTHTISTENGRKGDSKMNASHMEPKAVLPFTEDLALYFKSKVVDVILESVITGLKDGRYPVQLPSLAMSEAGDSISSQPETPKSQKTQEQDTAPASVSPQQATISSMEDDYDPFAYTKPTWSSAKPDRAVPVVTVLRPPTPAQTPPPQPLAAERKFHELVVIPDETAVAVQNSLRSALKNYFPPGSGGYHQFQFPLLPELESLWTPVFRSTEPGTCEEDEEKVDNILAIGTQNGVKKEYSASIMKQLDKYGTGLKGPGRSGRLDFRYLLANAMQAFTAQPLANQTYDNPFTNSYLLATLIIPHLETYLALHSGIKYLLLEYPPSHLPTVLALQKLVGVGLMKVAQIVDSESKERLPFTKLRGSYLSTQSDDTFGPSGSPSPRSSLHMTASTSNFLLSSTASQSEIAGFVSAVWGIPVEASESNSSAEEQPGKPEKLKLEKKRKAKPAPLKETTSPFPKPTEPQSPPSPTAMSQMSTLEVPALSRPRPASIAETVKTVKTSKSRRRSKSRHRLSHPVQGDGFSVMTYDPSEDSDYDQEERRLMPLFLQKPKVAKDSSHKALKFLGLA